MKRKIARTDALMRLLVSNKNGKQVVIPAGPNALKMFVSFSLLKLNLDEFDAASAGSFDLCIVQHSKKSFTS